MSPARTPASPPSSPGSGSLELAVAPSPRLLLFLAAWGTAAAASILDCGACGSAGRAALLGLVAAGFVAGAAGLLPGVGRRSVRALRLEGARWEALVGDAWQEASVRLAVEVLRGGWWLELRGATTGRRHWVWIDASRSARAPYRALCRALRARAGEGGQPGERSSTGRSRSRLRRRLSRPPSRSRTGEDG